MPSDTNFDLKKHVATIHSANKLSLVQRKIANALLFNAYDDLLIKSEYVIHISELCRLIGYNSNEQRAIKRALVSLISTVIEWNLVDKDKLEHEEWNASAIIADASIKGPVCTYSYSNRMRKLLHSPEIYGRINMQVQSRFKSSYGLALYENCIRYHAIKMTPWLDLFVFKRLMGVEPEKYAAFKDFRKRVIDVAIKEINQHTDYQVEYQLKRVGKKVVAIKFHIGINPVQLKEVGKRSAKTSLHTELAGQFAFQSEEVDALITQYGTDYVQQQLAGVQASKSYRDGKVKHGKAYLMAAMQGNYQGVRSQSSSDKDFTIKPEVIKFAEPVKEDWARFCALSPEQQVALQQAFVVAVRGSIYEALYQKDGLDNTVTRQRFILFLQSQWTVS